jgi:hypothetical protein
VDAAWESKSITWLERANDQLQKKKQLLADLAQGTVDTSFYDDPTQARPPSGSTDFARDIVRSYGGAWGS